MWFALWRRTETANRPTNESLLPRVEQALLASLRKRLHRAAGNGEVIEHADVNQRRRLPQGLRQGFFGRGVA